MEKCYATNIPTEPSKVMAFECMLKCNGVPVYRVNMESKSNKGVGSQSRCVACGMLTNIFCIVCKKWLYNPQSTANRSDGNSDDPRYIKIRFDNQGVTGKTESICTIYSCWHKLHQVALEAGGALSRGWQCSFNTKKDDDCSTLISY